MVASVVKYFIDIKLFGPFVSLTKKHLLFFLIPNLKVVFTPVF